MSSVLEKAPITQEAVAGIAEKLQAQGKKTTLASIREALGGGSYSTISPHFQAWKEAQKRSNTPGALAEPLPQAVLDGLEGMGRDIWRSALEVASARYTAERESLSKDKAESLAAQQEAIELSDRLNGELDAALSAAADARVEIQRAREALEAAQVAIALAREEVSGLQGQNLALREQIEHLMQRLNPAPAIPLVSSTNKQSSDF